MQPWWWLACKKGRALLAAAQMSKSGTKLRMALHFLSEVQKYSTTLLEENNSLLRDSNCKWFAKLPELRDFIPTLVESASASLYEQHSCMSTGGSKHLQNAMESLWKYNDQLTHRSSYSAPLNVHSTKLEVTGRSLRSYRMSSTVNWHPLLVRA